MRKRRLRGDGRGERGCTLLRADAFWAVCVMCVVVCACVEFCKTFIGHHTHALTQPVPERPRTTHAARSNNMPLCPAVPRACSRVSSLHTLRSSLAAPPTVLSLPARTAPCPLPHHQHPVPTHVSRSLSHQPKSTQNRAAVAADAHNATHKTEEKRHIQRHNNGRAAVQ